jgi:histone-lysine N-methyltransferase SETMAR
MLYTWKNFCKKMLPIIEGSEKSDFGNLLTGDESIIYWSNPKGFLRMKEDDNIPTRVSRQLNFQKIMVVIFWSGLGVESLHFVPRMVTVNPDYFVKNILKPLNDKFYTEISTRSTEEKEKWLHVDNASYHNSLSTNTFIENSVFERISHPPFSPDIAPSNYYLFGRLKQLLHGIEANSDEECKNYIKNALQ